MRGYVTYAVILNPTGKMDIVRYSDVSVKLATDLVDGNAVRNFVCERGGFLGLIKEHKFLGRYREVFVRVIGADDPYEVSLSKPRITTSNVLASFLLDQALRHDACFLYHFDNPEGSTQHKDAVLDKIYDLYICGNTHTMLSYNQKSRFRRLFLKEQSRERLVTVDGKPCGLWVYDECNSQTHYLHYDMDPAVIQHLMPLDEALIEQAREHNLRKYGPRDPVNSLTEWEKWQQAKKAEAM